MKLAQKIPSNHDVVVLVDEKHARASGVPKDEFEGRRLSSCLVRASKVRVVYVGIGKAEDVHPRLITEAVGKGVRELLGKSSDAIAVDLSHAPDYVSEAAQGVVLGAYKYEAFVPKERKRKKKLSSVSIVLPHSPTAAEKRALNKGTILGEACNTVREIGNSPPNVINPPSLADRARKMSTRCKLKCKVWNMAMLKKEKFGGILAVGQGSESDPRFIVIEHKVKKKAPTIAVVGKAITFDTGGISLKPGAQMDEMKFDKMGGCAVIGVMEAVSRLNLPVNVIGLIPAAENMPDGKAYRPGDIVTSWDGKTIEVLNTDAEGRIVLADGLAYARAKYKPDVMIDMATLTGACVVALGNDRAAMFATEDKLADALYEIGERCGERVWRMPMGEEFDEMVESKIANVKNLGGGRWGGACSAASFLKTWVGEVPWVHLDIAGTGWTTSGYPHMDLGATGFGVRLVTEFIAEYKK